MQQDFFVRNKITYVELGKVTPEMHSIDPPSVTHWLS